MLYKSEFWIYGWMTLIETGVQQRDLPPPFFFFAGDRLYVEKYHI